MVEHEKEKYGWEFLFLGANMDAITVAHRFGINADRAVRYECDQEGISLNYRTLSRTVSVMRRSSEPTAAKAFSREADDWADEIREDYMRRHNR